MKAKIVKKILAIALAAVISTGSVMTGGIAVQAAAYGFVQTEKGVMWANKDGSFLTNNWLQHEGKTYWLNAEGLIQYGYIDVDGDTYLLHPDGRKQIGWYQDEKGIHNFGIDGKMVRNSVVEGFEIGADGAVKGSAGAGSNTGSAPAVSTAAAAAPAAEVVPQSSSDKAILVAQMLSLITTPNMTQEQKLRAAYNHVMNITSYKRTYETPAGDWTWSYAMDIYSTGKGNCYRYAAAFAYLAKGLGYETRVVTGSISARRGGVTPHGWVEVKVGDTWYIFDPDMQDAAGGNYYMRTFANYPVKPLNKEIEWPINL